MDDLTRFSDPESALGDYIRAPWSATIHGQRVTVATNGKIGAIVPEVPGHVEGPEQQRSQIEAILSGIGSHEETMDGAALREWFAAIFPAPVPTCDSCKGKGTVQCEACNSTGEEECVCICGHEHTNECDYCCGTGGQACPECQAYQRYVPLVRLVGPAIFGADVIRPAIEALPDGPVRVRFDGAEQPYLLECADARFLLMGVRDVGQDRPRLTFPAVSNG